MGAEEYLPARRSLAALRRASADCHGCDLYRKATQTVFGEGAASSRLMLVGEEPGDQEDRRGRPFVGPAGALLDRAMGTAHIDRDRAYVTNAVKHFKWEPRGSRRLHKTPSARERAACRPWLMAELDAVRPGAIVCLGATASQSLMGSGFRLTAHPGEVLEGPGGVPLVATRHPSAILRMEDRAEREAAFEQLVSDLALAWSAAGNRR